MMNLKQFYLAKIAEEATEVAKIALKAAQFGLSEIQPGRDESNAERMYAELNDLFAMVFRLNDVAGVGEFRYNAPDHMAMARKIEKVERYLAYSRSLGLVEPERPAKLDWIERLMDSMQMELATEVSAREETTVNGHTLVVEERRSGRGRYGQWIVDGEEVSYEKAIVTILRPQAQSQIQVPA